jgi:hypothetical protein
VARWAIFVVEDVPRPTLPRHCGLVHRASVVSQAGESSVEPRRWLKSSIEIESAGGPFKYKELWSGGQMGNLRRMILAAVVQLEMGIVTYLVDNGGIVIYHV